MGSQAKHDQDILVTNAATVDCVEHVWKETIRRTGTRDVTGDDDDPLPRGYHV
jgi:hypothetical protein